MKILLLAPKGFEFLEFSTLFDVLAWANDLGCNTEVVTCGLKKQIPSAFGAVLTVNTLVDDINLDEYDALAITGGFREYGYYEDVYSDSFLEIIRAFHNKNKIIASICTGALPLGKSGILSGKKATTYWRRQEELAAFGAEVVSDQIVVNRNIITSNCPGSSALVAFKFLEMLTDTEKMNSVKAAMGF